MTSGSMLDQLMADGWIKQASGQFDHFQTELTTAFLPVAFTANHLQFQQGYNNEVPLLRTRLVTSGSLYGGPRYHHPHEHHGTQGRRQNQ
jgi:hypothetical protein